MTIPNSTHRLMTDPAFEHAIKAVREHLFTQWTQTPFPDQQARESIYNINCALELVISQLEIQHQQYHNILTEEQNRRVLNDN